MVQIDLNKAKKKWSPLLENMGVNENERLDWMSEYAEYHSINENAYANLGNFQGMGGVANPTVAANPGNALGVTDFSRTYNANGNSGSGDYGQQLLPVAMKIAAQTIGLDLVSVKPTPGPKIDLMYIDFAYDDNENTTNERPQVFAVDFGNAASNTAVKAYLDGLLDEGSVTKRVGGLSKRVYAKLIGTDPFSDPSGFDPLTGKGLSTSKQGWVEFLGYSRIDLKPMFRIFRQANVASATSGAAWGFVAADNTFDTNHILTDEFAEGFYASDSTTGLTASSITGTVTIELVSALEDHLPAFAANFESDRYPQTRAQEEVNYPGIIAPRVQSKTIQAGTIEISTALKRTEIEDIKANLGIDIVQKMESILVNELSQTISKQIIFKLFEMGNLNRESAPGYSTATAATTVFDLNVDAYLGATASPGGETSHAVQRKLVTKILHASNYLATEGRVGPAQFVVTNGRLAAALADIAGYTINPVKSKVNGAGQLYPMGTIGDVQIYVDPYMLYNDNRMLVGRKNNPDQPGIVFVPYLMAQSISLLSEATFAPRMLLRSRYAIAELGWYPQKQYMTILVNDTNNILA
jgi:hypothetical protein